MSPRVTTTAAILTGLAALALAPSPCSALDVRQMKLASGATLLVSEQHQLPMVTMSIAFDAGWRRDPRGKAGLATLTAESLTEGTSHLTVDQFNEKVDFMGSSVEVNAGQDYSDAGFTSLKRYQNDTLRLLAEVLQNPGLREADIARKRDEQAAAIKAQEEQPGYVAGVTFKRALFDDAPYGHPGAGTSESVAKLTPDDVRAFYKDYYKLGSAVIVVVGDVRADEIKAELDKDLTGLPGTVPADPTPAAPTVSAGLHATMIDRNVAQANLILGFGGIARSNPDYYRCQVMNYVLGGGGFASRLMKVVRSKEGLAYSVGSAFNPGLFPGSFGVVLQTKNKTANQAIRLVIAQMREIQDHPITDAELSSAKKFLIGSFPIKLDRQGEIANFLLQVEIYGLGLDYAERYPQLIGSVTQEDVQRVARQYLHPDAMLLVAVADQREAAIDVASLESH